MCAKQLGRRLLGSCSRAILRPLPGATQYRGLPCSCHRRPTWEPPLHRPPICETRRLGVPANLGRNRGHPIRCAARQAPLKSPWQASSSQRNSCRPQPLAPIARMELSRGERCLGDAIRPCSCRTRVEREEMGRTGMLAPDKSYVKRSCMRNEYFPSLPP